MEDSKQTDLNVDSLWFIPERAKYGKHSNIYHGNFIPQIPNQLIRRYTNIRRTHEKKAGNWEIMQTVGRLFNTQRASVVVMRS